MCYYLLTFVMFWKKVWVKSGCFCRRFFAASRKALRSEQAGLFHKPNAYFVAAVEGECFRCESGISKYLYLLFGEGYIIVRVVSCKHLVDFHVLKIFSCGIINVMTKASAPEYSFVYLCLAKRKPAGKCG